MKHALPIFTLSALLLATVPASAQYFNPTDPAHGFNAYTMSALTFTSSDTRGPVATGGDLILAGETSVAQNYYGKYPNASGGTSNYGLVVGGRVYYNSGNQSQAHGQIKIGNTTGSTVAYVNGTATSGHVKLSSSTCSSCNPSVYSNDVQPNTATDNATTSTGLNFSSDFSSMSSYSSTINDYTTLSSSQLSTLNINFVTIPSGSGTVNIPIVAGSSSSAPKINVINITSTNTFSSNANYQFSTAPSSSTIVIINIATTGTYSWTQPNVSGTSSIRVLTQKSL